MLLCFLRNQHTYPKSFTIVWSSMLRASVKPTYGINFVLKSPPYAEIQDQRRPPYFNIQFCTHRTKHCDVHSSEKIPPHVSISPAYLWRNCVCACARPLVCRSVICSYWTSCLFIFCLLHDFVATLRLSALPSALYFILSKLALWPPHSNSCSPCFP